MVQLTKGTQQIACNVCKMKHLRKKITIMGILEIIIHDSVSLTHFIQFTLKFYIIFSVTGNAFYEYYIVVIHTNNNILWSFISLLIKSQ